MLRHGTQERWSKEALQKKWNDLHSEQASFGPEYEIKYEMAPRNRHRVSSDLSVGELSAGNSCWSDEGESSSHSMHECDSVTLLSALSNVTMDEVRNRALSDANTQIQLQQQQMIYEHQQRNHNHHQNQNQHQNGWDSGQ